MIKTIIFDFGGVIFDLETDRAMRRFAELGVPEAEKRLDKYQQRGIFGDLERGQIGPDVFHKELEKLCGRTLTYEQIQWAWMGYVGEVNPLKLQYMQRLRERGYRVVLLSNINPYVMPWAHSSRVSVLGRPIDDYVDAMYLSFEVKALKPDRAFFDYLIAHEGVDPRECLFVDDGPRNVEVGASMGMATLLPVNNEMWIDRLEEALDGQSR